MSKRILAGLTVAAVAGLAAAAMAKDTDLTISVPGLLAADYRAASASEHARSFASIVAPGHPGAYDLMDQSIIARVGGVIFVEVARPAERLGQVCPNLAYDGSAPFGSRVKVIFSSGPASADLADWEIKPLVSFVESGDHGLVSLMKSYASRGFVGQAVEVHPSVIDTLVGFDLLLADSVFVADPVSAAGLLNDYELRGFNRDMSGEPLSNYNEKIAKEKLNQLSVFLLRSDLSQIMFTDWRVPVQFDVQGGKLIIKGNPYFLPVKAEEKGRGTPSETVAMRTADLFADLLRYNPVLFQGAFRFAHGSAFFRYMKLSCQQNWQSFVAAIRSNTEIDTVRIPTPVAAR